MVMSLLSATGSLSAVGFLPHRSCFLLDTNLILLHVVSDALIAFAYMAIPVILLYFHLKRREHSFGAVFYLFAAFIVLCGVSHILGIWTMWHPDYYFEGLVKAVTAAVSVATAIALIPIVPKVLALKSPAEWEAAHVKLKEQVLARQQAEDAQIKTIQELKASNLELERFAYIASHDLQAPLRTVSSFSQLLEQRYGEQFDERAAGYFKHMRNGVELMQRLIDDLLQLSRLNTQSRNIQDISLASACQHAMTRLGSLITESGASIKLENLPTLKFDRSELVQLFQNLIGNAIKFQPQGQKPEIVISAERVDGKHRIGIKDNGIGIDEKYRTEVFEIFRRLHTQEEFEGTGIGLALVKKIVDFYQGEIEVDSVEGEGTTITLVFPENREVSSVPAAE